MQPYNPYKDTSEESFNHIILQQSGNHLVFSSKSTAKEKREGLIYWLSKAIRWLINPDSRLEKIQIFFIKHIKEAFDRGNLTEAMLCCSNLKKFESAVLSKHNEAPWTQYLFWTKVPLKYNTIVPEIFPLLINQSSRIKDLLKSDEINSTNFESLFNSYKITEDFLEASKEITGTHPSQNPALSWNGFFSQNKTPKEEAIVSLASLFDAKNILINKIITFMSAELDVLQTKISTNSFPEKSHLVAFSNILQKIDSRGDQDLFFQSHLKNVKDKHNRILEIIESHNSSINKLIEEREDLCLIVPTLSLNQVLSFDFSPLTMQLTTYADATILRRFEEVCFKYEEIIKKPRYINTCVRQIIEYLFKLNIHSSATYGSQIQEFQDELSRLQLPEWVTQALQLENQHLFPLYLLEFVSFLNLLKLFNPALEQWDALKIKEQVLRGNFNFQALKGDVHFQAKLQQFVAFHTTRFLEVNVQCEKSLQSTLPLEKLKELYKAPFISKENKKRIYTLFWEMKLKQLKEKIGYIYQHDPSFYSMYISAPLKDKRVKDLLLELEAEKQLLPYHQEYQMIIQGLKDYLKLFDYQQYDARFFNALYADLIQPLEQLLPSDHPLFDLLKETKAQPRLSVLSIADFLTPTPLLPKIFEPYLSALAILAKVWIGDALSAKPQTYPTSQQQDNALLAIMECFSKMKELNIPTDAFRILKQQIKIIGKIKELRFHPTKGCLISMVPLVDAVTLKSSSHSASSSNAEQSSENTLANPHSPRLYNRDSIEDWLKRKSVDPFTNLPVSMGDIHTAEQEQLVVKKYFDLVKKIEDLKAQE